MCETETRPCKKCGGTGVSVSRAFTATNGTRYSERRDPCWSCEGRGQFPVLDIGPICKAIRGRKAGSLRAGRPKYESTIMARRAYYVWRLARFHGGADVTLPMGASMDVSGDPFRVELDALADKVAKAVYGTDLAAAHRWGHALGHLDRDMPGLPASAYSGGPVLAHGAVKPQEELPELY